jgi:hypothetical protein
MEIIRVLSAANTKYELICKKLGHVIARIIINRALKGFSFPARLSKKSACYFNFGMVILT